MDFVDQIRARVGQAGHHDEKYPRLAGFQPLIWSGFNQPSPRTTGSIRRHFCNRRGESISRDVAAWLCRQLTSCTLRELAAVFGLGHADSVRNRTRRVDRALADSSKLRQDIAAIRQELLKTERI